MGCSSSAPYSTNASKDNAESGKAAPQPPLDSKVVAEVESKRRGQTLTENIVTENLHIDVHDVYDIDAHAVLGKGISGIVRPCIHRSTKIKYALKTLDKTKLKASSKLADLRKEVKIMAQLDHPNIMRLHESFETPDYIYLVTELCHGGELLDRLYAHKGHHYTEKLACRQILSMLRAVRYCHSHSIVHRDLKLENFLYENQTEESELKLIDFGLSNHFEAGKKMHHAVGTPYYVAPEVLSGSYDSKCDIWSLGVLTFMLLSGLPPFYGSSDEETLDAVKVGRFRFDDRHFKHISKEGKNFISACLTKVPSKRPSAGDLTDHPWFNILQLAEPLSDDSACEINRDLVARLRGFQDKNTLVRLCMEVVAHTLLPDQISKLRDQFSKFDKDQSGEITYEELKIVLQSTNQFSDADIDSIFESFGVADSGKSSKRSLPRAEGSQGSSDSYKTRNCIRYHEFCAAALSHQYVSEDNIRLAFEKISKHSDAISAEDIKELLGAGVSNTDVDVMMREMSFTPKNPIKFDEFQQIMKLGLKTPANRSSSLSKTRSARKILGFFKEDDEDLVADPGNK